MPLAPHDAVPYPIRPSRHVPWMLALAAISGALALAGCAAGPIGPVGMASGADVAPPAPAQHNTRIVVVRHAEKTALPASDPPLDAAGRARAVALREALLPLAPTAAYATRFARTQQTAAPVAEALGLAVRTYDAAIDEVALARQLLDAHPGGTVLVVGHSNTVPGIVSALCRCPVAPIDESRYGDRFDVTVDGSGAATLVHGRY